MLRKLYGTFGCFKLHGAEGTMFDHGGPEFLRQRGGVRDLSQSVVSWPKRTGLRTPFD